MSRPRKSRRELPPYVYPRGKALWLYAWADGKLRAECRLCDADVSPAEVWQAYEARQGILALTFRRLADKFEGSPQWRKLAPSTRRDYRLSRDAISRRKSSAGPLGDLPVKRWTPGLIRQIIDKRSAESPSRARHEGRYVKRLFSWAYERDLIVRNIGRGIMIENEPRRQRYVTDAELAPFLAAARASRHLWLAPFAEITYRCRLRASETLNLTDASITPDGLLCARTKGSETNTVRLTGALAAAVEEARQIRSDRLEHSRAVLQITPGRRYLFVNLQGGRLSYKRLNDAWNAVMATLSPDARFLAHDLKRKGISDTTGDKRKAAGHRSPQMTADYDVKPAIVEPAGSQK